MSRATHWLISSSCGALIGCPQNVSNRFFTLVGIWDIDFQAAQHEIQQGIEVLEANIAGQSLDMLEEHFAAWQFCADQLVLGIYHVEHGVEQEGQQIQGHQQCRQILLAVPEVVSQVIALGF